jgi:probable rRNA maturation factor
VLSFALAGGVPPPDAPLPLGDVVLALGTLRREARQQGKSLRDHFAHLVVHGVLHLCGHDHAEPSRAARMERIERRVLATLGIADPYESAPSR